MVDIWCEYANFNKIREHKIVTVFGYKGCPLRDQTNIVLTAK